MVTHHLPGPSAWVERWLGRPHRPARLLDVAAGSGRHARLAAGLGFRVLAVDRDADGLHALVDFKNVETRAEDLESGRWSFTAERFDVVVVTHYLFRPRLDLLPGLLRPGGRLIYETFAVGQAAYGKPSNPDFLLRPGELLGLAARAGLGIVAYEDGVVEDGPTAGWPTRRRLQRIVALRPPLDREAVPLGHAEPPLVGRRRRPAPAPLR